MFVTQSLILIIGWTLWSNFEIILDTPHLPYIRLMTYTYWFTNSLGTTWPLHQRIISIGNNLNTRYIRCNMDLMWHMLIAYWIYGRPLHAHVRLPQWSVYIPCFLDIAYHVLPDMAQTTNTRVYYASYFFVDTSWFHSMHAIPLWFPHDLTGRVLCIPLLQVFCVPQYIF